MRCSQEDLALLGLLAETADAVGASMERWGDRRALGRRPGQFSLDLVADEAACRVLHRAGMHVLSEESGLTGPGGATVAGSLAGELLAVLDPVDGSTNASSGLPWYATSLCVLDGDGPRAALVANLVSGARYEAVRGAGAWRDGAPLTPSGCRRLGDAVVGISGLPGRAPGWAQFRALGAASLDLCLVAEGALDGFRTAGRTSLRSWDYLGGVLVCTEAGAVVADDDGSGLVVRDASARRPVAAATPELLAELLAVGA